nr:hypothetical protein [Tanacetum cinerariifolium]
MTDYSLWEVILNGDSLIPTRVIDGVVQPVAHTTAEQRLARKNELKGRVNPTIYVSCIKQFWSSVSLKKTNDVIRLQALIDRRKVIITEDTVRQALYLDDDESIDCFPNKEIFAELERMGYKKPSTKLTFYKAFFSAQ